ncbi:MAG: alpha/beta fold hydrolase [Candidatus Limnocylindria bacterium]
MSEDRIHRSVSPDGTEIVGRVYGQGAPLVLVHGSMADGEMDWGSMLPFLTNRFTCFVLSTRGRGLSATHPDLSRDARVGDVAAFVESVGEPVALAGLSEGGMLALGAAARAQAVAVVAAYEPLMFDVIDTETRARLRGTLALMEESARAGSLDGAAATFVELVANEEEQAALAEDGEGGLDEIAKYLPLDLEQLREAIAFDGPSPTDPSSLDRIAAPALLLHGSRSTLPWFADGVRYAADHVPDATVQEITGTGHLGPIVQPERVADQLVPFLQATGRAA